MQLVSVAGSSFTATTNGGALLIEANIFVFGGWDITCVPEIDGVWAGTYAGRSFINGPSDPRWIEGLVCAGACDGGWHEFSLDKLYTGVPAGSHTFSIACLTDGNTGYYCTDYNNTGLYGCAMSFVEYN